MDKSTGIGWRIVAVRKALGLTQQKFAENLKISQTNASALERNPRGIPDRTIKMICLTYGVNENWLKTGKGDMFEKDRDFKLEEVIGNFKKLDDLLQDYVLKQIRLTLEYQEKANAGQGD
ncbi:MAG: helix-turn-helix domain-containing protein [Treponema sp.]|nr:helix-turn-helix domain-containing protein [Treponema sp.]